LFLAEFISMDGCTAIIWVLIAACILFYLFYFMYADGNMHDVTAAWLGVPEGVRRRWGKYPEITVNLQKIFFSAEIIFALEEIEEWIWQLLAMMFVEYLLSDTDQWRQTVYHLGFWAGMLCLCTGLQEFGWQMSGQCWGNITVRIRVRVNAVRVTAMMSAAQIVYLPNNLAIRQ